MAQLYLIPVTLGDSDLQTVIPDNHRNIILSISHFIVENVRTARRFLKKVDKNIDIDSLHFYELNKHTDQNRISSYLQPIKADQAVGIMSEAGCPGVADPGAEVVRIAHQKGIQVVPMVGPSSILLAMMASGMNGQNFAFNGYLPIKKGEKGKQIKLLENRIYSENQSQLFIEAPYRNLQLLDDLLNNCQPHTKLCIACDLTLETEFIKTKSISEWKKSKPAIQKRPAIFILGK
ncbi:SAM-dependent methyltransferase [Sunxiuqinia elliptica]|uniref:16S rRNA (Cytidine1402-2'-O)-methyltransferase n=1 Tax=Sunxiuqinia elliptica TaxID=655355 RepID=A0A4R6GLC4_9BACT|nr:SAM-dependent methyltransferase [Sunxiuqinia elliptica]TDN95833.1 16S rRNA (cytidine1402-2'-O)-methyltransferase [Sunxiuqinia elliptica]TDO67775.1 16S rRNA (cytidine1402-2'-O)-methyltransferase [Sunxiuqinia elliptica]